MPGCPQSNTTLIIIRYLRIGFSQVKFVFIAISVFCWNLETQTVGLFTALTANKNLPADIYFCFCK